MFLVLCWLLVMMLILQLIRKAGAESVLDPPKQPGQAWKERRAQSGKPTGSDSPRSSQASCRSRLLFLFPLSVYCKAARQKGTGAGEVQVQVQVQVHVQEGRKAGCVEENPVLSRAGGYAE